MSFRAAKPFLLVSLIASSFAEAQALYDFGNPTADEQLYIELINRSRANPPAEGVRLATTPDVDIQNAYAYRTNPVNLTKMQTEFNGIAAVPPLAPHAALTTAARGHSNWMLLNASDSHQEGATTPTQRIIAAGYPNWGGSGENLFAYVKTVPYGHAGLNVDWGNEADGMRAGRGHRAAIHNPTYREIGVGVTYGTNGLVGPQLVTQDFAVQSPGPAFATGVAYYDLNGNNFYDSGEGIGGLKVNVSGATDYCRTAVGGGWVVPVPVTAATRTVSFTELGITQNASLTIPAATNAKLDLKLAYTAPTITNPATATTGTPYNLSFSAVGGAVTYNWKRWTTTAAPPENCDSASSIASSTATTYNVQSTTIKQEGSGSFHLLNGGTQGNYQSFQLNSLYRGLASPTMTFQSRLRYSSVTERYKVQVKEEGTPNWVDAYSQTGSGGSGEAGFSLRTATISSMANKSFRVRFLLQFSDGSHYSGDSDLFGWFIDAVNFGAVLIHQNEVSSSLPASTGTFTPSATGTYLQAVYPVISGNQFPAAYQNLTVSAPVIGFASWAAGIENANSLPAGSISLTTGDYDKDGRSNLLEYAFGTSPVLTNEATPRLPVSSKTSSNLFLDYQVDTSLTDLVFTVEASADLSTWKTPGQSGAPANFTDQPVSTNGTIQSRRATIPLTAGTKYFIRVRTSQTP